MYKIKFYLLHGWYRDSNGHFKHETVKTNTLDDNTIDKFRTFERERFKVDYIEVVYDYNDCEGLKWQLTTETQAMRPMKL